VVALRARGEQAVDLHRAVGTVLETFGNHDFDFGPDRTRELVAASPAVWVSANVRDADGGRFAADEGVVPWAVRRVDGTTVGFFGVTDPATGSLNPMARGLSFGDPVAAGRRAVDRLRAAGVDRVVALSHLGGGDDALAALDVDAILGGHVHSRRADRVDGTLIVRPGVNGRAVAEVDLEPTPSVRFHETGDAAREDPAPGDSDDSFAARLRERRAAGGLDEVLARVDEPIERSSGVVHGGECRVGNLVADAYRWATGAEVGLANAGGIRPGDPIGLAVTRGELIGLVPFDEPVVLARVPGGDLRDALGEAAGVGVDFGEPDWWHGHVSGARIVHDPDGGLRAARVGGEPIDPDREYAVATASYLLGSDDEFPSLGERHRVEAGPVQYEALTAYARDRGLDPAVEGRIRRVGGDRPAG
jgi:2',3'-cyclic-nucleotide 2'-phosphodiesterase (5'-nucleotidase family)